MAVILYSSDPDPDEQRLLARVHFTDRAISRSLEALRARLNDPGDGRKIVILFVRDHGEMIRLSQLLAVYTDLLLIIVLGLECPQTDRIAHRLRPRYTTCKDGDFQDVSLVLERLRQHCGWYRGE